MVAGSSVRDAGLGLLGSREGRELAGIGGAGQEVVGVVEVAADGGQAVFQL